MDSKPWQSFVSDFERSIELSVPTVILSGQIEQDVADNDTDADNPSAKRLDNSSCWLSVDFSHFVAALREHMSLSVEVSTALM